MNTLLKKILLALGTACAVAACGSDFDPGSRVSDYRLVAVALDKPYAAPGEEVVATTLAHEPFGRPVTYAWTTCLAPRDSTVNACLEKIAEDARAGRTPAIQQGPDTTYRWRVPDTALSELPPETRPSALAGIVTIGCPGTIEVDRFDVPRNDGLPFRCIEAGSGQVLPYERWVVSVKRVFLRTKDRNLNPSLAEVRWNGAAWPESEVKEVRACDNDVNTVADCTGGEEITVAAVPAPGAVERGVEESGTFEELVVVQNYASEGTFEFEARTAETAEKGSKWVARASAKGKEISMWFVIRDNRGGVSWVTRRVRVRG